MMKLGKKNLARLKTDYSGYIEGDAVGRFFDEFGIRFAAGHWCAGGFTDRFNPDGYLSDDDSFSDTVEDRIRRVAEAGVKGIEFHDTDFIDAARQPVRAKIASAREVLERHGLSATNMNTNLFSDPKWKLGGVTHAVEEVRQEALEVALRSVDIGRELGCESVALWPGSDGWDYNFQVDYGALLDRMIDACIAINKACMAAGLKFGIEAKLHEPREGNMVVATTHKAALIAMEVNSACGGANMGVAIDYGHEQMYAVEPADTVYCLKRFGVPLVNFHINNAKLHSNDEDRIPGTGDNWRFADFCYAALDTGYDGWFGEDQFTYRMEPVAAVSLAREMFANVMKKALSIYAVREELHRAQSSGEAAGTIEVVKRILV